MAHDEKAVPVSRPENDEVARQVKPQRETRTPTEKEQSPDWYQRSRPAEGVRTREGDRSDWSGSSWRGQIWSGGRER
jgi:hypothetical protein